MPRYLFAILSIASAAITGCCQHVTYTAILSPYPTTVIEDASLRFKQETGKWPQTRDDVQSRIDPTVSQEIGLIRHVKITKLPDDSIDISYELEPARREFCTGFHDEIIIHPPPVIWYDRW